MSNGKKWHNRRKAITPAFHFQILEQFIEIFDQIGNKLIEIIQQKSIENNGQIELYPLITLFALDVVCRK